MSPSRPRRSKALTAGRANKLTTSAPSQSNLSSSKSRQIIRNHHSLSKAYAQALKRGDDARAAQLESQIEAQGGLERYQEASKAGQSVNRGRDSSKVLMEWLRPIETERKSLNTTKLKLLEVGALSTDNACSRSECFEVTRIDLNSQNPRIIKQDFMLRPLPQGEADLFDCVSLSLVVNFVPDPVRRGDMLERVPKFLRPQSGYEQNDGKQMTQHLFPSLFLVLPAPCVTNSRYTDENRLIGLMSSIGFRQARRKMTAKLVYYLWVYSESIPQHVSFPKVEVNPGKGRNNFAIVLR